MNNIYINFELNDEIKGIEQTLLSFTEQDLNEIDLLNILIEQEQKRYLFNLLLKYETICLGDLILSNIGAHKWKLEDRRYSVRKYRIKVLNTLPWSVGTTVNVDSDRLVENVVKTESRIEAKESNECDYEHSDDEIHYFKQRVRERLGTNLVIDYETIASILTIIDESIGELYFDYSVGD